MMRPRSKSWSPLLCLMLMFAVAWLPGLPRAQGQQADAPQTPLQLSDFLRVGETRWSAPRGLTAKPAQGWNDQTQGVQVTYTQGGGYTLSYPQGFVTLGDHRWLSFWIKGDGGTHNVYLHIREGDPDHWDQFYVLFQVQGDQWQPYTLDLSKLSRNPSPNHALVMRYFKSGQKDQPTDHKLTPGNRLFTFSFHLEKPDAPVTLSFSDLQAHIAYPNLKAPASRAAATQASPSTSASGKRVHPYAFVRTDASVSIALVAQNQSDFRVVIPASPTATETFAANELVRYLKQATGADLPVVSSDQRVDGKAVYLSTRLDRWNLAQAAYTGQNGDGFALGGLDERTIVLTGGSERGMLFGVYAFLEKAAGIRFFRPIAFGEVIPPQASITLPLFKDQEEPVFTWRRNHYCSDTRVIDNQRRYEVADWSVKNRYNVELERLRSPRSAAFTTPEAFYAHRGGIIPLADDWQGHNFHKLIPTSLFAEHPEYFPFELATGQRRHVRAQLCVTNKQVHRIIADKAIAYFREHDDQSLLYLCQEDGHRLWCQCPDCLALNPSGGPGEQYFADQNIHLVNEVAKLVEKEFPDKSIGTYAYTVTRRPPVHVKPHHNVVVMYCGFASHSEPGLPAPVQMDELRQWGKLLDKGVIVYEYLYSGPVYRELHDGWLSDNHQFFKANNVRGAIHETSETWSIDGFKMYASTRLAWNPDVDMQALRQDYYEKYYGPAARPMASFDQLVQDTYFNPDRLVTVRHSQQTLFSPEDFKQLRALLAQAYKLTRDDVVRTRIGYQHHGLNYIETYCAMVQAVLALEDSRDLALASDARQAVDAAYAFVRTNYPLEVVSHYNVRQVDAFSNHIQRIIDDLDATSKYKQGARTFTDLPLQGWKLALDPDNQGEAGQWFAVSHDDSQWHDIRIAEFWEKQGHAYDGMAWYRRTIDIPADFAGRKASLVFMGVDERAWVYLDGKLIGSHAEGDAGKLWLEPFTIDLTPHMRPGQPHQLTVRVHDSAAAGGIWKPIHLRSE